MSISLYPKMSAQLYAANVWRVFVVCFLTFLSFGFSLYLVLVVACTYHLHSTFPVYGNPSGRPEGQI